MVWLAVLLATLGAPVVRVGIRWASQNLWQVQIMATCAAAAVLGVEYMGNAQRPRGGGESVPRGPPTHRRPATITST